MHPNDRSLIAFVSIVCSLIGCADEAQPISSVSPAAEARAPVNPAPASPRPSPRGPTHPPVGGTVVDEGGAPVLGRPVTLVDRRGIQTSVMTDDGGMFWVLDVAPPYDVVVSPAPSGSVIVPLVFLGLTRSDPNLVLAELDTDVPSPSHTLRFEVMLPPCPGTRCWVSAASMSPSGGGTSSQAYGPGETSLPFELEHAWRITPGEEAEAVDLHVVTGDENATEFWYLRAGGIMASPGGETDLATLTPDAIEATAPVTISTAGAVIPPGWDRSVTVGLGLPGGVSIPFRFVAAASFETRLPRIENMTFVASASAQAPRPEDRPLFQSSVVAWSGPVDLRTNQVLLDLPPPTDLLRPREQGTISRHGRAMAWSVETQGLSTVELRDLGRGRRDFRVVMNGDSLSFGRLARLGLDLPEPGAHLLDVTVRPRLTIDDAFGAVSRALDPGASSHTRIELTVTP